LSNTVDVVKKANKLLLDNFPEIKHTVCKIGAGEIPTDPTPMETGDYIITLKDKSEWTSADTREELVEKMEEKLSVLAGVKFEFQQPIQMRSNELLSGSKQDIAIKIFGDDLPTLAKKAEQVEHIISSVDGVSDINVEKVTGLAQVQVSFDRDRLAQYGLSVGEANRVLRTAFAGTSAGVVFDREQRFPLVVRLDKDYRQKPRRCEEPLATTTRRRTNYPRSDCQRDHSIGSGAGVARRYASPYHHWVQRARSRCEECDR
jgi:Putative silver efflux pump